ncbi:MAG: type II toxin-antitoxin system VapC family toxin [Rhodothermales bacterium]
MNVIDASAWIEFFKDGPNAAAFQAPILDQANLLVPATVLYEVFQYTIRHGSEQQAMLTIAAMRQGRVIDIDAALALSAAGLSRQHNLPMADSLVLAVARRYEATLWTQDADLKNLEGVRYFGKA